MSQSSSAREEDDMRAFADVYPLDGVPIQGDKPDYIIRGDRCVGVELSELYQVDGKDSAQHQIKVRKGLLTKAQELYRRSTEKQAAYAIGFNDSVPLRRTSSLEQALVTVLLGDWKRGAELPKAAHSHIREIRSVFRIDADNIDWQLRGTQEGGPIDLQRVEECIRKKELLLGTYAKCDAHWLLLTYSFFAAGQGFEPSLPREPQAIITSFEKVFVFERGSRTVVPIPVIGS
jgi:hypothetical protein